MATKFNYPEVERNESLVGKIFGRHVADPYRHLEDPHQDATKAFVEQQNAITRPFIEQCPHREKIKETLTSCQDYTKLECPFKRGKKYYFFMNEGLQAQSVLYQQDTIDSEPRVFYDPNTVSDDGTVALSEFSFSPNGEYFAYGLSYSGSDWIEIRVRNVSTGEDLNDQLTRAKFTTIEWTHDNKGFFYAQFPSTENTETGSLENHSLYYHVLNTQQLDDILKVSFPNHPGWCIDCAVSHDGRYLHVFPQEGCHENSWYYCELDEFGAEDELILKPIYDQIHAKFDYITNIANEVYFRTNLNAKNYRVAKLTLENPASENWTDVIANHPEDVLEWAESFTVEDRNYLLVNYMRKVVNHLELYDINKGLVVKKFITPHGTIVKETGHPNDNEFLYLFNSFLSPGQIFHFNLASLDTGCEPKLLRQVQPKNFNPEDYKIEQVFYRSKDGTQVPMFIVHRKNLVRDGQNPCILYGYGGFNSPLTSEFDINRIVWLRNFGGILAVANIRGGGEFGQDWHDSGRLLNKQNCFDDFIAAGEFLIENNYTKRDKLAIEGESNGGLLVAAVSNQRPDLFGATICHVGVLDMLRFTSFTCGSSWTSDFGDPNEKVHFENLINYSPYHNIPDAEALEHYPASLLTTADHDDRVVPAHSLKFIAQLQHKLGQKLSSTPLLIRVDTKAGHGFGRPTSKLIDEYADVYSFLCNVLGLGENFSELA